MLQGLSKLKETKSIKLLTKVPVENFQFELISEHSWLKSVSKTFLTFETKNPNTITKIDCGSFQKIVYSQDYYKPEYGDEKILFVNQNEFKDFQSLDEKIDELVKNFGERTASSQKNKNSQY